MVTKQIKGKIVQKRLGSAINSPVDLVAMLESAHVDVLICGGISNSLRETLQLQGIAIVDNVACSIEELLDVISTNRLRPGYGTTKVSLPIQDDNEECPLIKADDNNGVNCLSCVHRQCCEGEDCLEEEQPTLHMSREAHRIIEAALDVSQEKDRILCRVSELVYFCLEMGYRHIGIAYCTDLWEPTEILASVLSRFFQISPVCCKVGGVTEAEMLGTSSEQGESEISCNPIRQAWVLNRAKTQINIIVGLCLGADCLFASASEAPVTTFLVKDKSLAHNPIGALYSEYYLKESLSAATHRFQYEKQNYTERTSSSSKARNDANKNKETP